MTEPDDQQWSRRRLRNEAHGADPSGSDSETDAAESGDLPRATPLSPRGPAEPLSYITQERGSSDGGAFRPRRDDDTQPPTEAIEQVETPGYRARDYSPEGRTGVPSWAPAYTQTRNPFASTADQAAQGQADEHGELDYQTARRDEVVPPAAETGVNEPPPITESIPIFNGERTMTRRELRALREARAAEAAKTGVPAPDIFVTSITGLPQERPSDGDAVAAPASAPEVVDEPAPIDRPATERPAWAPVFTDVPDAVAPTVAEPTQSAAPADSDAAEIAEEETFLAGRDAGADAATEPADDDTAVVAEPDADAETADADDAEPVSESTPTEAEVVDPIEPAAPSDAVIAGPPTPVELVEPPAPARWNPDASGESSVFDQLLSGGDAPATPAAPSIDELLFGAPTPPPATEADQAEAAEAGVVADAANESAAVESFEPEPEPEPEPEAVEPEAAETAEAEAAAPVDAVDLESTDPDTAPVAVIAAPAESSDDVADAADDAESTATEPVGSEPVGSEEPTPEVADADDAEPVADEPTADDVVADEPAADEPAADEPAAGELPADEEAATEEPQLPSLGDLPPPGAAPAEPNGDPNSFLGAAPSVSDRVDMPAPPAWRAPEPPQQDDADEIVVEPAPADAPVEAHPVVVDVTPLPAEPLPPVDATSTATHWSDTDQDAHGDFVASRDVIGGHGVVTTNALVLPSIPQPELAGPLTTTGEIIITGSIDLPRSLSSTGAHPTQLDESALDHELDPGDHQVASTDSQPVRAIRAVSTHTSTRGMMSNPKPRSNRTLTVLIIASASLAVLVAGVLVFSLVTGQF
ncbi:hypothetical protein [Schumannella soli]|uniref:Uncharacterized protein n=1 Tax=Schumannella soli TaxID=2590779 RepID=A0A506XZ17_9MICO|nr:hypothetical protein [Schumannella soli]TPW74517.1 hypothetical protein FJ657_13010 [Schumannella soli]